MIPRIGRGRHPPVYYNTGHGHLGWTLSGATAAMIGDAIARLLGRLMSTFVPRANRAENGRVWPTVEHSGFRPPG